MSTEQVFPVQFQGIPTLTPVKVHTIKDWYFTALNDARVSTEEGDIAYYLGMADAHEYTLDLLHDIIEKVEKVEEASKGNFKRAVVITGVVALGYYVWKNQKPIKKSVSVWVDVIHYGAEHPPKNLGEVQTLKKRTYRAQDNEPPTDS